MPDPDWIEMRMDIPEDEGLLSDLLTGPRHTKTGRLINHLTLYGLLPGFDKDGKKIPWGMKGSPVPQFTDLPIWLQHPDASPPAPPSP